MNNKTYSHIIKSGVYIFSPPLGNDFCRSVGKIEKFDILLTRIFSPQLSEFFFAFKRGGGITFQEDIHPCIKYWRLHQDYEKLSNIHLRRMNKVEDKVEQRKILKCGLIRRIKEGTRLNSN